MMRERERCDRGQPDAFGILQQAFIRRMAFNMTPTKFPTEQILIASILATIAFLLIYMVYVSIKKSRAVLVNGVRDKSDNFLVVWTLLASLLLHILFSYYIVGHKTDIGCFTSWGNKIFRNGFQNFYNPQTNFPDYPPGYMYVLGLMARIADLFGHGVYAADGSYDIFYVTMIKLPSIIADIGSAYLVYRLARKKLRFEAAYLLMCLAAFCPVFIYVSGGWGQIDQILSILLVISIILLNSNKPILAGFVYGLSILLKPQALMAGPLLAIAYFCYIFDPDFFSPTGRKCTDGVGTRIMKTVAAVACACALLIVSVIPFADDTMPWYSIILQKYMGTATSYKYASVNAYNIYTLFGKNWTPITEKAILGLTYGQLGTVLMVISVGFGGVLYFFGRKKHSGALSLATAFTFASLFTLGHYMHERYLFPVLLLLLVAYISYGDRRLISMFMCWSATALVNCIAAFYYSKLHEYHLYWDERLVFWCSLANVILFIIFCGICTDIMLRGRVKADVFADDDVSAKAQKTVPARKAEK